MSQESIAESHPLDVLYEGRRRRASLSISIHSGRQRLALDTGVGQNIRRVGLEVWIPEKWGGSGCPGAPS